MGIGDGAAALNKPGASIYMEKAGMQAADEITRLSGCEVRLMRLG